MKHRNLLSGPATVLVSAFLALPGTIHATPVPVGVFSAGPDVGPYLSDVATTDLINGMAGSESGANWQSGAGTAARLTNGLHGAAYTTNNADALANIAWANPGSVVTFDLGLGDNGAGYDIKSIRSIADWINAGFGNQHYTLEVQPVGGSFTTLATVNYTPLGSGGVATKVTITDDGAGPGGYLATGIQRIRFTHNATGGATAGRVTYRELDVFGTSTVGDTSGPLITDLSPADNTNEVPTYSNLEMTFDEIIALGTGNITIRDLDTPSATTIAVTDTSQVSISGAVLTINPASLLAGNTSYAVWVDSTAITDLAGNAFAGIVDDSTWSFTTGDADVTPPAVTSRTPADDASVVLLGTNLVLTFDEPIAAGAGNIVIKDLDGPSQTVIPVGDAQVSVWGSTLSIDPASDLAALTNYAVTIGSGTVTDLSGNPFGGIADDTAWNIFTQDAFVGTFSTTQFTYDTSVSASDLLNGLIPSPTAGWNLGNEASPDELTDGIHGADFGVVPGDRVQGGWTNPGATAEYDLGTGANGLGYDLNSIQSIADWSGVGFGNQAWTMEVKPVGGGYRTLATVDYQPLGTGAGSTRVTLTDPSGVLASGIEFIRITANAQSGHVSQAFVWRELDVFGVDTGGPASAFADWAASNGVGSMSEADDSDTGGRNNLYEFAFGGDPLNGNDDGGLMHPFTRDVTGGPEPEFLLTVLVRSGATFTNGAPATSAAIDGIVYSIGGSTTLPVDDSISVSESGTVVTTGLPAAPAGYEYKTFILDGSTATLGSGYLQATVAPAP